jgi:hypothetical protein
MSSPSYAFAMASIYSTFTWGVLLEKFTKHQRSAKGLAFKSYGFKFQHQNTPLVLSILYKNASGNHIFS